MKSLGKTLKLVAVNLAILAAMLAALELIMRWSYIRAEQPPAGLAALFRQYYSEYEGQAIQAIPECARYDPAVAYTLRPGRCTFTAREFSTTVRANSAGFRDDETSLQSPVIVLAGDSFTMGWGVEQEETFAQGLELALGQEVLNSGMSSFGTVRELRALMRLDLDSLRVLVIQHHPNDFKENRAYRQEGDTLHIMSEADYAAQVEAANGVAPEYRFGRFVYEAQKLVTNGLIGLAKNRLRSDAHQADEFLHVLATAPIALDGVGIVVFEVADHARNDSGFVSALAERLDSPGLPAAVRRMTILDLSGELDAGHFHAWDGHLNREGHAVVAAALAEAIRLRPELSRTPDAWAPEE